MPTYKLVTSYQLPVVTFLMGSTDNSEGSILMKETERPSNQVARSSEKFSARNLHVV